MLSAGKKIVEKRVTFIRGEDWYFEKPWDGGSELQGIDNPAFEPDED